VKIRLGNAGGVSLIGHICVVHKLKPSQAWRMEVDIQATLADADF